MSIILNQSIASVAKDRSIYPYYGGKNSLTDEGRVSWRPLVPSRDKHKRELGFGQWYDTYQDLLRDPHMRSVDQKRRMAVITRPWDVAPASQSAEDQKVAHFVKMALQGIGQHTGINRKRQWAMARRFDGFTTACYKLLSAYFYGFSVGEIIWGQQTERIGGKTRKFVVPKEIKNRSQRRFGAKVRENDEYELVIFTANSPMGESLAEDKFIACFYDEDEFNPLGFGLAPSVYYPIEFKRRLVQFSLAYADRFGSPQMIGKFPSDNPAIKKLLDAFLQQMGQEGYGTMPDNAIVDILQVGGQGNDMYEALIEFFNREISKSVLGETGTTDQQGSGGSRARDQVGNDVRLEIAYADAMLLADTLNTFLVPLIVYYNFGKDVACPSIKWYFPEVGNEEDLDALVMRVGQIVQIMQQRPPKAWIEEKFGIPLEAPEGGGMPGGLDALFGGAAPGQAPKETGPAPEIEKMEAQDDEENPNVPTPGTGGNEPAPEDGSDAGGGDETALEDKAAPEEKPETPEEAELLSIAQAADAALSSVEDGGDDGKDGAGDDEPAPEDGDDDGAGGDNDSPEFSELWEIVKRRLG